MCVMLFFFLMIRRPPRSTLDRSSAASDVYKRQAEAPRAAAEAPRAAAEARPAAAEARPAAAEARRAARAERCLLYTSPSPRDRTRSRMPSSA